MKRKIMKKIAFTPLLFVLLPFVLFAQTEKSSGTGFFAAENGIIITCAHVIEDGNSIKVKIEGKEYDAQVLSKNDENDLAVLKINYRNPYHFKIVNFSTSSLGDKIYVLGFPLSDLLGSDIRLTDGIISARSGVNSDQTYFQLSAPVQPGNSGGPVINSKFEVIGVAAAKLNDMATLAASGSIPQNINFAVKSEYIFPLMRNTSPGSGNIKNMNDATNATVQILCYETRAQSGSTITIVNKTGYMVYYVYVSPVSSDTWGSDKLGAGVLPDGQSVNISSLPLSVSNQYDIRLVDEDGDSYTRRNVRLSPNQRIEFSIRDLDSRSNSSASSGGNLPSVRITNNTGYTVYYVYVSPTSSENWGTDVLDDDVLYSGQSVNVRLPTPLNVNSRYDIRLKDSDGDTYTKYNVLITPNSTIVFTLSDID